MEQDDTIDVPPPPTAATLTVAGSPGEPPLPGPVNPLAPLAALRSELQPIARDLLADRAYWEQLKRNASPRTFLEFVRFAFAADLEGKTGGGGNAQVIIQAPFPRGPLDVLPPHMTIE